MGFFEFFVMVLGTQRLTGIWFEEIARPLRERVQRATSPKLRYLAGCPLCISVWAAFGVAALWQHSYGRFVVTALALASGVNLAELLAKFAWRESPVATAIHQVGREMNAANRELNVLNGQIKNATVERI